MSAVMPLNRPRHLLSALVALSLALAVPVVAVGSTSAAPVPRPVAARMTSVGLSPAAPDQAARAGSVAAAESSVVETGGSLRVVGVTWPHGDLTAGDRVEIRERANGAWGGWATLEAEDDHGPDPGTAEAKRARGGTEPFITTADAVQVRVLGQHRSAGASARLDVVDPRSSAADHASAPTAGAAEAGSVRPTIYSRAKWGADESLKRGTPSFGTIRSAVVHHTAGSNSYTADQVPGILRGIYDFHVNGRGWNDVGYNFFIDKFGRIWEGRAGGTDLPVVGAQAGGYNSQTFGASTLGDFTSVAPPAAVVTAQSKLIAWKLGPHQHRPHRHDGDRRQGHPAAGHRPPQPQPDQLPGREVLRAAARHPHPREGLPGHHALRADARAPRRCRTAAARSRSRPARRRR